MVGFLGVWGSKEGMYILDGENITLKIGNIRGKFIKRFGPT